MVVWIAEVTAVGIYMGISFPETPQWLWALSSIVMMGLINLIAVKVCGECDFWFALIKVVAIAAMIALGGAVILFDFTNDWQRIGLSNLWQHGGFFPNGIGGSMTGVVLNYFVPDKAFQYMIAAVTFTGLMVWIAILITQIQFRRSLSKSQVADLAYRAPWWHYS